MAEGLESQLGELGQHLERIEQQLGRIERQLENLERQYGAPVSSPEGESAEGRARRIVENERARLRRETKSGGGGGTPNG